MPLGLTTLSTMKPPHQGTIRNGKNAQDSPKTLHLGEVISEITISFMMFIPVAVGVVCSAACSPLVNKHYLTLVKKHNGKPPAEARLIPSVSSPLAFVSSDAEKRRRALRVRFPTSLPRDRGPRIRDKKGRDRSRPFLVGIARPYSTGIIRGSSSTSTTPRATFEWR